MDWKVSTIIKVRWGDMDALGHVNNAKYFTYMEQARVAYFKKIPELDFGTPGEAASQSIILAAIQCNFLAPAKAENELKVKIRTRELKKSSFIMDYEIENLDTNQKVATGESTLVYFDYKKGKSLEIPNELRKKFAEIEGREF